MVERANAPVDNWKLKQQSTKETGYQPQEEDEHGLSATMPGHVGDEVTGIEQIYDDRQPTSTGAGTITRTTSKASKLEQLLAQARSSEYFAAHKPPDVEWVVDGVLESNGTAMVYGDSGIGKTFLAMHLAYSIGAGKRWFDHRSKESKVLYLDGENGEGLMHRRSQMMDPEGEADLRYLSFPALSLEVDGQLLMASLVKALHADVLVIDPLMNFMQGDENSIQDIRPQIKGLRAMADELNIAIVLIHHENRSGGYRGSSGFKDLVTLQLHIKRSDTQVPNFTHVLDAIPKKQRQSKLERFTLAWKVVNGEFTAGRLAMMEGAPKHKVKEACCKIHTDTGEWPGKDQLVKAKDIHGLSQNEAKKALSAAVQGNRIELHVGAHNKHEYRVVE